LSGTQFIAYHSIFINDKSAESEMKSLLSLVFIVFFFNVAIADVPRSPRLEQSGIMLADFEDSSMAPALSPSGSVIANNSDQNGNPSAKAAYYRKASGNWIAIYLTFAAKQLVGKNDRLIFKIRSSSKGRVFVKVVNNGQTIKEDWAPEYNFQPEANVWTECTLDISSIRDKEFDRLEINGSVDNLSPADIYLDDFRLANSLSPNGEPIIDLTVSKTKIIAGESIHVDASGSMDNEGSITSFNWKFGDGSTSSGSTTDHMYASDGVFSLILTVTDNEGKTSSRKLTILVLPQTGKLSKVTFAQANYSTFEKIEGAFASIDYSNPYDPAIVSIDASITLPDAEVISVPCFYYEKSVYQSIVDKWSKDGSAGYWLMRFSSSQVGVHKIKLKLVDSGGSFTSSEVAFTVNAGSKKGFIKTDVDNKQFYRHISGEKFFPFGINIGWNSTSNYSTTISNLSKANANFIRYWQVPFDRQGLEWKNGSGFYKGLGVYSQEAAAEQDSIISLCNVFDVYAQLTLFQHGMFSETVDSNWSDNPYNVANGGPLSKAEEYFYNTAVKERTKKLLRYIIARWGYSANVFAWELFNEVNFTGAHPNQSAQWYPAVLQWHNEMGQYIKSIDPFGHIVATSSSENQIAEMDKLTGLDNVQYHLYNSSLLPTQITKDKSLKVSVARCGLINGEYGENVSTADVPLDVQRISIFTGVMTQVPHIMWKWENYMQQQWADVFKSPAAFLKDEDFSKEGTLTDWSFSAKTGTLSLSTVGFQSAKHNAYAIVFDPSLRTDLPGTVCDVSSLVPGTYSIAYFNIETGATTTEEKIIESGSTQLTLPNFSKALAIKFKLISASPVTGIQDGIRSFACYPNPTHDTLNVQVPIGYDSFSMTILDGKGSVVYRSSIANNPGQVSLSLKNLGTAYGVYFLRIKTSGSSWSSKFMYQKEQ
jgi:PKD repeat protein